MQLSKRLGIRYVFLPVLVAILVVYFACLWVAGALGAAAVAFYAMKPKPAVRTSIFGGVLGAFCSVYVRLQQQVFFLWLVQLIQEAMNFDRNTAEFAADLIVASASGAVFAVLVLSARAVWRRLR